MTRPSRDGLEPGMIVEHRQRYVVTNQRYPDESLKHAGQLKLRPVGDVEQVAIAYADRMAYGLTAEDVVQRARAKFEDMEDLADAEEAGTLGAGEGGNAA